ncbi:conjugative transposon protein TraM, partial [Bacteroides sp. ET71]|nr:conjugative transposon protein TraM [Bacteroides sp. ET71]
LAVAEDDTDREAVEDVFQTEETASSGRSSIRTSADAYRDINRQIGSFYEQPEPEDDQKTLELEWRIQELERRAEEERKAKETADEQLRLMEKSYEMASRYLPQ